MFTWILQGGWPRRNGGLCQPARKTAGRRVAIKGPSGRPSSDPAAPATRSWSMSNQQNADLKKRLRKKSSKATSNVLILPPRPRPGSNEVLTHPRFTGPQGGGYNPPHGEVLELADRRDLGSRAARREGSNPSFPTAAKQAALRLLP